MEPRKAIPLRLGLLLALFASTFALGQDAACGPHDTRFTRVAVAQSEASSASARLYIIQKQPALFFSAFGFDGKWLGAIKGRG